MKTISTKTLDAMHQDAIALLTADHKAMQKIFRDS